MTRAGNIYDRLREQKEGGILERYHDHPNIVSMLGRFRTKKVHWLLRLAQSRAVVEGVAFKQDRSQVQPRKC